MEGWNDPPKHVGPPTGNLKINLNKRVAFPQTSLSSSTQATPLLLPPKPPSVEFTAPDVSKPNSSEPSNIDLSSEKENVIQLSSVYESLSSGIEELSQSVQASAANKLKTLESDWTECDSEVQKLLVELVKCLQGKDAKSAAVIQRKIVMKGCNKPWVIAIRQIVMHLETIQAENNDLKHEEVIPVIPKSAEENLENSSSKTEWI